MPEDLCQVVFVDQEKVAKIKEKMTSGDVLYDLAEIFKVLGDASRVKILHALSMDELCVCDLAALLGMSQSAVSHQLRLLRTMKLVKFRKEGKMAYYSFEDSHVRSLFEEGLRHAREG